jgi:hypothetical protein
MSGLLQLSPFLDPATKSNLCYLSQVPLLATFTVFPLFKVSLSAILLTVISFSVKATFPTKIQFNKQHSVMLDRLPSSKYHETKLKRIFT